MKVIEAKNLCKGYSGKCAVDEVNLGIEQGQVYGLLGKNGSGKTTLLRLLLGIEHIDSGGVTIFGEKYLHSSQQMREKVFYIAQNFRIYDDYSLEEWVHIVAPLYEKWDWNKADELLTAFELSPQDKLGTLSGGQRQKAYMILAFSCGAEILILDEPASALDPVSRRLVLGEMMNYMSLNEGKNSIVFSTHLVNDLERVANKVGMMRDGKITHEFDVDTIRDAMVKLQVPTPQGEQVDFKHSLNSWRDHAFATAVFNREDADALSELETISKRFPNARSYALNLEDFFLEMYGPSELSDSTQPAGA